MSSIERSKDTSFSKFVYGLGIRNVGEHLARILETNYNCSINRFRTASLDDLEKIESVGPIVAREIFEFWSNRSNCDMIEDCFSKGVTIQKQNETWSDKLEGKIFVFTGTLQKLNRKNAQEKVQALGGRHSSSISKNTDFVVAGPGAGTKLKKAKQLDIQVMSEDDFLDLINNG